MNTLAIALLEVQLQALTLTLFGALFTVIILNTECIDNFFKNLGKTIQRKPRHKEQKIDVKEHKELPMEFTNAHITSIEVHNDVNGNIQHSGNVTMCDAKDNMQFS